MPAQEGLDVGKILQTAPDGISVANGFVNLTEGVGVSRKKAFLVITLNHDMYDNETLYNSSHDASTDRYTIQAIYEALGVDSSDMLDLDTVLAVAEYRKQVDDSDHRTPVFELFKPQSYGEKRYRHL